MAGGKQGSSQPPILTGHIQSLDGLRGMAAFIVLMFHFPHFYSVQTIHPLPGDRLFNTVLWPIYDYGWMAVDLFFQLSGFVFFWLYATAIAQKRITFTRFISLRLFRLYPLHLLTLFIVAGEQLAYGRMLGGSFVYTAQDGWHFALNLVMANGLPFAGAESFNGPSWSLSVEMLLYALFFLVALCGGPRLTAALGMTAAGLLIYKFDAACGRGISGFFTGGALYLLQRQLGLPRFRIASAMLCLSSVVGAAILWLAARSLPTPWNHHIAFAIQLFLRFLLFPSMITLALSLETSLSGLWRWTAKLGDISYSTYLLHIPLQIAMVVASAGLGLGFGWLVKAEGMLLYLLMTTALGVISFHGFERPVRERLKRISMRHKAAKGRGTAASAEVIEPSPPTIATWR
ncbi:MAG: acyltransferase [Sphingomonadales bacterium]|nr:acyltransferase [Sphingomonadales bacterium]MDE2170440.1 acyltransferase [Sphingomonadales bacterium]